MSKGSDIGEGILFGVDAKCNQERDPENACSRKHSEFGVDCGRGFCLHRQNLLPYFQNLRTVQ